jgi:PBP1b-binding outer membrane lipoprotein LpoB
MLMKQREWIILAVAGSALLFAGCATQPTYPVNTGPVDTSPGRSTVYEDVGSIGRNQGIGMESQDIASMTDKMVGDMLATPALAGRKASPRVIIDSEYFKNESSTRINKNIITDRLRVELNRAANGRMIFVGRHYSDMVERERALKRDAARATGDPMVDKGTLEATRTTLGGDFRMGGRITTLDSVNSSTGLATRMHQIVFEMVDLENGMIVWSGIYDFKKTAQDDVLYR